MLDTLLTPAITGGGAPPINWTLNVIFFLSGLLGSFIYFWSIIRAGTVDEDTFKEFFAIRKNQNQVIRHLVVYVAFITIWILEGGAFPFMLIGDTITALASLVSWDIKFNSYYASLANAFPKGQLNIWAGLLGGSLTFLIRNVIPAIVNTIKGKFKKD